MRIRNRVDAKPPLISGKGDTPHTYFYTTPILAGDKIKVIAAFFLPGSMGVV